MVIIEPWGDHYLTPKNTDRNLEGSSYMKRNFNSNGWMKQTHQSAILTWCDIADSKPIDDDKYN